MNEGELYKLPEVSIEEITVEEFEIVRTALCDSQSEYRTIGSLHRQTDVEPAKVASILANSDFARKSIFDVDGESLFAPIDRPKPRKEKLKEILSIISRS